MQIVNKKSAKPRAWIIAVDMGYGHQRTAYPLRHLAPETKVINANSYKGISKHDRGIWESTRTFYEFISRFKRVPIIGEFAFAVFDKFQSILTFYPKRDLSKPNFSLLNIFRLIKNGWGRELIKELKTKNSKLPIISTFFTPAFMAEENGYPGDIFCIVCDADIARPWASLAPQTSNIKYFTPNQRTLERLTLYGVKKENIFLTGYPLPKENIGTAKMEITKNDLKHRLLNLDPQRQYRQQYSPLIKKYLGKLPSSSNHILTIMFAIGGAGAQNDIAINILESLQQEIEKETIKIILSVGIKKEIKEKIIQKITKIKMAEHLNRNIEIIFTTDINEYFHAFSQALRTTDILWTKPSELSFYTGLGLPMIMAPTIGAQEQANKKWLLKIGSGIPQGNPKYTHQWLFDLLNDGWFAEAAMQGFIETEKLGTYNIEKIIAQHK